MSVSNTTVREIYQGTGAQTSFPIPFQIIKNEPNNIKVSTADEDGVITPVDPSDYSLMPNNSEPTSVDFLVAPPADLLVIVERVLPLTQIVSYINTGAFNAKDHERAMDRIVMMLQQINEQLAGTLKLNIVDVNNGFSATIPKVLAGQQVILFDGDEQGLVFADPSMFQGPQGVQGPQGIQGPQGLQGPTGETGYGLFVDAGAPNDGLGNDADVYIDKTNFNLYYKIGGTWVLQGTLKGANGAQGPQGNTGPQGVQGIQGNAGINGTNGKDGATIYTGPAGPPIAGFGKNEDIFISSDAPNNYWQKITGNWVAKGSLQGLQGPKGDQGDQGATGFGVFADAGVPNPALGNDNDVYFDVTNYNLYYKIAGTWENQGSFKGAGVPAGGLAGQIYKKASNADYDGEWANEGTGARAIKRVTNTNYTVLETDKYLIVQSSVDVDITLPDPTGKDGLEFHIKQIGAGKVTLIGLVDDGNDPVINPGSRNYVAVTVVSENGGYYVY